MPAINRYTFLCGLDHKNENTIKRRETRLKEKKKINITLQGYTAYELFEMCHFIVVVVDVFVSVGSMLINAIIVQSLLYFSFPFFLTSNKYPELYHLFVSTHDHF